MIDYTEIIKTLIPALLGGGLVALFTLPEKKGGARLDNAERVLKRYEEIIERLDKSNTEKDDQIRELQQQVSQLQTEVSVVTTKLKTLQMIEVEDRALRCEKLRCTKRKPRLTQEAINDIIKDHKDENPTPESCEC